MSLGSGAGGFSELLKMETRLRGAGSKEALIFIFLNELMPFSRYTHSAWWSEDQKLKGHSGASALDRNSSYCLWLEKLCAEIHQSGGRGLITKDQISADLAASWSEYFPNYAVVAPIWSSHSVGSKDIAIFAFEERPMEEFISLLHYLAGVVGHAFVALTAQERLSFQEKWKARLRHPKRGWILAAAAMVLLFPLRLSVMAPVDVVASDPFIVRSAADGVVKNVYVEPNSVVKEGAALFDLDPVLIDSKLDTAIKARAVAETELRQASQQMISDTRGRAYLASLNGRLEERQVEVDYLRELKSRLTGIAPKSGLVLVDDPKALIGRPLVTGERIMSIVDEFSNEVEFWIPAQDLVLLPEKAPVKVFLNTNPFQSGQAEVKFLNYEPILRADGILAYRGRAILKNEKQRVGLRGVARVDSYRYPLIYVLLRRPIMIIRHYFGF